MRPRRRPAPRWVPLPLAWLGPSVDEEIRRAGQDGVGVVIAPISFVSEHSETLVELDRDYRRLAESSPLALLAKVPNRPSGVKRKPRQTGQVNCICNL